MRRRQAILPAGERRSALQLSVCRAPGLRGRQISSACTVARNRSELACARWHHSCLAEDERCACHALVNGIYSFAREATEYWHGAPDASAMPCLIKEEL